VLVDQTILPVVHDDLNESGQMRDSLLISHEPAVYFGMGHDRTVIVMAATQRCMLRQMGLSMQVLVLLEFHTVFVLI